MPECGSAAPPLDRTLEGYEKVGTVRSFVNTIEETTAGKLGAGESVYLGITLKMQETASNDYQNLSLGGAFDIQIVAGQLASEKDSIDDQHDKNATYTETVFVSNTDELRATIAKAKTATPSR